MGTCRFLRAAGANFPTPCSPTRLLLWERPGRWWVLRADLLQTVVVWGTAQVGQGGEAVILTKVHSDVDIQAFEVAFFDETR